MPQDLIRVEGEHFWGNCLPVSSPRPSVEFRRDPTGNVKFGMVFYDVPASVRQEITVLLKNHGPVNQTYKKGNPVIFDSSSEKSEIGFSRDYGFNCSMYAYEDKTDSLGTVFLQGRKARLRADGKIIIKGISQADWNKLLTDYALWINENSEVIEDLTVEV